MAVCNRPILKELRYGRHWYDSKVDFRNFFDNLNYIKSDISNNVLYLQSKTVSQNKLRDAGFIITRDINKANVIVIEDFLKHKSYYEHTIECYIDANLEIEKFFDVHKDSFNYILDSDLYKYLYKYDGNQELFYSCQDLLKSNSHDNVKMAMEFISNANWTNNEIYLNELFNLYYNGVMRGNSYKTSISFKGFLNSLDFNYESVYLHEASDYRALCKNEEHHEWIYKKYEESFKHQLDELVKSYKIKLDKIEYSIDRSTIL